MSSEESQAVKALFKEFREINRKSVYDNQASIEFPQGEENPLDIIVHLTPQAGPFKGGKISFSFKLPKDYPNGKPTVTCLTKVYHPNISFSGGVCFSMFNGEWSSSYRLEHYINGLLWLLQYPNHSSALNSACVDHDSSLFDLHAKMALLGLSVKGNTYKKSIQESYVLTNSEKLLLWYHYFKESHPNVKNVPLSTLFKSGNIETKHLLPNDPSSKMLAQSDGEVIKFNTKEDGPVATVRSRARKLQQNPKYILKEVIFLVGDTKVVLVITNDHNRVDTKKIAELCKENEETVRLAPASNFISLVGYDKNAVPAFGHSKDNVSAIIVNSRIFDLDDCIYTSFGVTSLIIKIKPSEFKNVLESTECEFSICEGLELPLEIKPRSVKEPHKTQPK